MQGFAGGHVDYKLVFDSTPSDLIKVIVSKKAITISKHLIVRSDKFRQFIPETELIGNKIIGGRD